MKGDKVYIGGCRSGKTVADVAEKLLEAVDESIYGHQEKPLAIELTPCSVPPISVTYMQRFDGSWYRV